MKRDTNRRPEQRHVRPHHSSTGRSHTTCFLVANSDPGKEDVESLVPRPGSCRITRTSAWILSHHSYLGLDLVASLVPSPGPGRITHTSPWIWSAPASSPGSGRHQRLHLDLVGTSVFTCSVDRPCTSRRWSRRLATLVAVFPHTGQTVAPSCMLRCSMSDL